MNLRDGLVLNRMPTLVESSQSSITTVPRDSVSLLTSVGSKHVHQIYAKLLN